MIRKTIVVSLALLGLSLAPTAGFADANAHGIQSAGEPVVRPGAKVLYRDAYCTMNFVFKGSDGNDYVGTAGHCPFQGNKEAVRRWKKGRGLEARDASGIRIGEFAFAARVKDDDIDFALIRLDRGVEANPEMEFFGGPTGLNDDITYGLELINMYGHGLVFGDVKRDRQFLTPNGFDDKESIFATGAASPGDSGAPVTTDEDEALGIFVEGGAALRIPESGPPYPGNTIIVRLPHNIALAEDELDLRLRLVTVKV
ncbi:MAG: S1 family peptidase [Actinomycetota bacterium]|nr:S1 family peptidase [Actinomycetota bacterium]